MQISIGTCISKYHINFQTVTPRKIEIRGTFDALAIQDENVEMCVRDEMAGLKDIKFELSLLRLDLGLREEEFPERTADLEEYLIPKLSFKVQAEVSGAHVHSIVILICVIHFCNFSNS